MAGRPTAPQVLVTPPDGDAAERVWIARTLLFTRVIAGLELLKGVVHWCQLLGIGIGGGEGFEGQTLLRQSVVIYFAVLNPVAAVGLWMGAPWGVVIWLFTAASQVTILFLLPSFPSVGWVLLPYELITIAAYVLLTRRHGLAKQSSR